MFRNVDVRMNRVRSKFVLEECVMQRLCDRQVVFGVLR